MIPHTEFNVTYYFCTFFASDFSFSSNVRLPYFIEFFHAEIAYGQTSLRIVSIIYHYIKNLRVTIANDLSLFLFSHACVNCPRDFRLAMGCAEPQAGQVSTGTCEKLTCIATKHQNPINIIRMVPFN